VLESLESHKPLTLRSTTTQIATNIGGIISSWIYPHSSAPQYNFAAKFNLAMVCIAAVLVVAEILLLRHLNRKKIENRDELLRDVAGLDEHEQFEVLGDSHPDFKYTL
jgi:dipeptide/tripeptide permease